MFTFIEKPSAWGTTLRHEYLSQNSRTLMVMLPGSNYPVQAPVFYYVFQVAETAGLDVLGLAYGYHGAAVVPVFDEETMERLEQECLDAVLTCLEHHAYERILFVGRSVGTTVQRRIARKLPDTLEKQHILMAPRGDALEGVAPEVAFSGTGDKALTNEQKLWMKTNWGERLIQFSGVGHSLDGESAEAGIAMLREMTVSIAACCERYRSGDQ